MRGHAESRSSDRQRRVRPSYALFVLAVAICLASGAGVIRVFAQSDALPGVMGTPSALWAHPGIITGDSVT
jgi:hypothetical protein